MTAGSPPCCIIAGVGPGIGLAVARKFAGEGFAVAMMARRESELSQYAEAIAHEEGFARGYPADLADIGSTRSAIARATSELGAPSVLIYNAAIWREANPMTIDPEEFAHDLGLSVTGALVCAQAVYPTMKAERRGTMLFTGGGLALHPEMGGGVPSLTAGKSALRGLVHAMAPVLAGDGIHAAMLTVAGMVLPDTLLSPENIAERFWSMYNRDHSEWAAEDIIES